MRQQEFEHTFEHLPPRQKEVLLHLLGGETDTAIAEALKIEESTVRKYIERISQTFGLTDAGAGGRRSKRPDIVDLFAQHKPDLLQGYSSDLGEINSSLLALISQSPNGAADLLKKLLESSTQEQKKDAAKMLNKLGHKSYMDGEFQSAISLLELTVKLNPVMTSAHYNLGSAYEKLDQKELALIHYEKAAQGDDRAAQAAMNNLARLQILQGEAQKACEQLEAHLEQVKDTAVKWAFLKNLGWAYLQQQKYAEAEKYLKEAIDLGVQRPDAYCLLAQVQEKQGNQQELEELWKNCVECTFEDKNAAKTAWRFPELEVWQGEARNRLKFMP